LWIDIAADTAAKTAAFSEDGFEVGSAFARKLAKSKSRPPLAWLGSGCCSRLQLICTGGEQYMEPGG
jgi:hypothetical protein